VNSALPLDTRATDTMAMNVEYDWLDPTRPGLRPGFGVGLTDPHLDNRSRPAPAWSPRTAGLSASPREFLRVTKRLEVMKLRSGRCHPRRNAAWNGIDRER